MKLIIPIIAYEQNYLKKSLTDQSFAEFIAQIKEEAQALHIPEGWVLVSKEVQALRNCFLQLLN